MPFGPKFYPYHSDGNFIAPNSTPSANAIHRVCIEPHLGTSRTASRGLEAQFMIKAYVLSLVCHSTTNGDFSDPAISGGHSYLMAQPPGPPPVNFCNAPTDPKGTPDHRDECLQVRCKIRTLKAPFFRSPPSPRGPRAPRVEGRAPDCLCFISPSALQGRLGYGAWFMCYRLWMSQG